MTCGLLLFLLPGARHFSGADYLLCLVFFNFKHHRIPHMRPRQANLLRLSIILLLLSGLPACGQKGDLYLPARTAGAAAGPYAAG